MTDGNYSSLWDALFDGTFHVVSLISTTGLTTMDAASWPMFASVLLLYCGLQCGCSGSTTGGLKTDRVLIAVKSIGCEVKRRLHPNSVYSVRVGNHLVTDAVVNSVLIYMTIYMLLIIFAVIILLATGMGGADATAAAMASISNLGVSTIADTHSFAAMPAAAKLVCTFNMFLGRVEIYPVLIVACLIFNRKSR